MQEKSGKGTWARVAGRRHEHRGKEVRPQGLRRRAKAHGAKAQR